MSDYITLNVLKCDPNPYNSGQKLINISGQEFSSKFVDPKKRLLKRRPEFWIFVDSADLIPTGERTFRVWKGTDRSGVWKNYAYEPRPSEALVVPSPATIPKAEAPTDSIPPSVASVLDVPSKTNPLTSTDSIPPSVASVLDVPSETNLLTSTDSISPSVASVLDVPSETNPLTSTNSISPSVASVLDVPSETNLLTSTDSIPPSVASVLDVPSETNLLTSTDFVLPIVSPVVSPEASVPVVKSEAILTNSDDVVQALLKAMASLHLDPPTCPPHRFKISVEVKIMYCEKCGKTKPV